MFLDNQVPPDNPRKEVVYNNFRHNLDDILQVGLDAHVKIILNTVAVNLKDCPPFASTTALSASNRADYAQLCGIALLAEKNHELEKAAQYWGQASKLDGKSADTEFQIGHCLLGITNYPSAREHFEKARDYDSLPFRADSRINAIIEEEGRRYEDSDLRLLDAAKVLASECPSKSPGDESFFEHVHFNFDGNFRLARAWADEVTRLLPESLKGHEATNWDSQTLCEQRLGLTDWNRYTVVEDIVRRLSQAPFTNQFDKHVNAYLPTVRN